MKRVFRLDARKRAVARDIDEEIAFHVASRVEKLVERGMPRDEAERTARRQFGEMDPVRDACITHDTERLRASNRADALGALMQDLRYAARTLLRSPAFTAMVVLTLALGIGANTSIFTLLNAVLLKELPVANPERLVVIGSPANVNSISTGGPALNVLSYPVFRDFSRDQPMFAEVTAVGTARRLRARWDGSGADGESLRGRYVSGTYFSVFRVSPHRGRLFTTADDNGTGASPNVVISHAYWHRRFAGADVVGRTFTINDVPVVVAGVAPPSFTGEVVGQSPDIWIPITLQPLLAPNTGFLEQRDINWLLYFGRLKDGVSYARARAEVPPLVRRLVQNGDSTIARNGTVQVSPGARGISSIREAYRDPLFTLMLGVGLLLLIACANIANLMLARSVARGREIGIRVALGAARSRLVSQLTTESALLALLGAVGGVVVSMFGSRLLLRLVADGGSAVPLDVAPDGSVIAFVAMVAASAVGLFGLAPALRSTRVDIATTLRASTRNSGWLGGRGRRFPLGKMLIVGQVALSLTLLVGAGLLVRNLDALSSRHVGFDRDHMLSVSIATQERGLIGERRATFARTTREALLATPSVAGATYSENGLYSGVESWTTFTVDGFEARTAEDSIARYDQIGPAYFASIGATLRAGREFDDRDGPGRPLVAIVNDDFVRKYFGTRNPVGARIHIGSLSMEIVGVASDITPSGLQRGAPPRMYFPFEQGIGGVPVSFIFLVRTDRDPALLSRAVQHVATRLDASLPVSVSPVATLMSRTIAQERLLARLASGFGVLALLLAAVGLYGVMSYAIARRTAEFGLRVALGARRSNIIGMVLGDAIRLVILGLGAGLPVSFAAIRLLRGQLSGIGATDPVAIAVAVGVLAASAVVAAAIPARRAARVQPRVALTEE